MGTRVVARNFWPEWRTRSKTRYIWRGALPGSLVICFLLIAGIGAQFVNENVDKATNTSVNTKANRKANTARQNGGSFHDNRGRNRNNNSTDQQKRNRRRKYDNEQPHFGQNRENQYPHYNARQTPLTPQQHQNIPPYAPVPPPYQGGPPPPFIPPQYHGVPPPPPQYQGAPPRPPIPPQYQGALSPSPFPPQYLRAPPPSPIPPQYPREPPPPLIRPQYQGAPPAPPPPPAVPSNYQGAPTPPPIPPQFQDLPPHHPPHHGPPPPQPKIDPSKQQHDAPPPSENADDDLKKELQKSKDVLYALHTFLSAQKKIEWMEKTYREATKQRAENWNHLSRIQKWEALFKAFDRVPNNNKSAYRGIPLLQDHLFNALGLQTPLEMGHAIHNVYEDACDAIHQFISHQPIDLACLASTMPVAQVLQSI